jgi:hypothetical protein
MRVIQTTRSRQTGTLVEVVDRGAVDAEAVAEYRDDPYRWETICVDHGGVCSHATLRLARYFAPTPMEWCEECMSTDQGEAT